MKHRLVPFNVFRQAGICPDIALTILSDAAVVERGKGTKRSVLPSISSKPAVHPGLALDFIEYQTVLELMQRYAASY